jgi:hypothetical protein
MLLIGRNEPSKRGKGGLRIRQKTRGLHPSFSKVVVCLGLWRNPGKF